MNKPTNKFKVKPINASILLALICGQVQSTTFTVTNFDDSGAGSLRDAVQQANSNTGPDTITFQEGLLPIGLASGQINITDNLTIIGSESGQIITASDNSRIFAATNPSATLIINSLELKNGQTNNILNNPNCSVLDGRGGAICAMGTLELNHMTISFNQTLNQQSPGGAIFANSTLHVSNSLIFDNKTSGLLSPGGAIHSKGSSAINNTVFSLNTTNNIRSEGGALNIASPMVSHINNSSFSFNRSYEIDSDGGAINGINLSIQNATFYQNYAVDSLSMGSAISSTGSLTITSSTVVENRGSGAINLSGSGILDVKDSIVSSNIYSPQNPVFDNILATSGGTVNVSYSIVGDTADPINGTNDNNISSDTPELSFYSFYNGCHIRAGAPSFNNCLATMLPLQQSPAINAASNVIELNFDQRGACHPRVSEGRADIGAVESNIDEELVFCGQFD